MIIKNLTLKNFRNHSYLSYEFSKGLNIFTGNNGAGKTNIVEAIYYLSLARSFRTQEDSELIKEGKEKGEIFALVKEGELSKKINVLFQPNGRNVLLNGKPVTKLSDLSKIVNVILFEPKDVLLFRGSPKARRNFLDVAISKKSQKYLECLSRYEKILKERNELLKQEKPDQILLETATDMLIEAAYPIIQIRSEYMKDIQDILLKVARALTGVRNEIEIHYSPFVQLENYQKNAKDAFKKALESDLRKKATSIGTHREDFSISLNGRDIAEFGSQGENRIIALSLKLSPYFLIEAKERRPIIVLDDVMSELDQGHRLRLIKLLTKFEQVFITATKLEVKDAAQYRIASK